jgi:hypothetical protein
VTRRPYRPAPHGLPSRGFSGVSEPTHTTHTTTETLRNAIRACGHAIAATDAADAADATIATLHAQPDPEEKAGPSGLLGDVQPEHG